MQLPAGQPTYLCGSNGVTERCARHKRDGCLGHVGAEVALHHGLVPLHNGVGSTHEVDQLLEGAGDAIDLCWCGSLHSNVQQVGQHTFLPWALVRGLTLQQAASGHMHGITQLSD